MALLGAQLRTAVASSPSTTAVVDGDVVLTYAELGERVARAAALLVAMGVGAGDVVAWQLPNWWEGLAVHHATLALGAISNPIMPILRERELRFMLGQSRARVLIVPEVFRGFEHAALARRLATEVDALEHVLVVRAEASDPDDSGQRSPRPIRRRCPRRRAAPTSRRCCCTPQEPSRRLRGRCTLTRPWPTRSPRSAACTLTGKDVVFMPSPIGHITGVLYGIHLPVLCRPKSCRRTSGSPAGRLG
jgi:cyclohexanecarboxylate-CoA ligase